MHTCIYIHTYTHTYAHTYTHIYTHTYTHTHINTNIHTRAHTQYIHTYIHTHTYIHIYTYIHICVCGACVFNRAINLRVGMGGTGGRKGKAESDVILLQLKIKTKIYIRAFFCKRP